MGKKIKALLEEINSNILVDGPIKVKLGRDEFEAGGSPAVSCETLNSTNDKAKALCKELNGERFVDGPIKVILGKDKKSSENFKQTFREPDVPKLSNSKSLSDDDTADDLQPTSAVLNEPVDSTNVSNESNNLDETNSNALPPVADSFLEILEEIIRRNNTQKRDFDYDAEVRRLSSNYEFRKVGVIPFIRNIKTGIWQSLLSSDKVGEIIRQQLQTKFKSIQGAQEISAAIESIAMPAPKNFFSNPTKILIPFAIWFGTWNAANICHTT